MIAEGLLEDRLLQEIQKLGARGYTCSAVHGHGTRGISESFWEGAQVKIETLVSPETAERILDHLVAHYFHDYAVIAYVSVVETVRGEKYL
jgi:nitrogen regulatory protein P-II 2